MPMKGSHKGGKPTGLTRPGPTPNPGRAGILRGISPQSSTKPGMAKGGNRSLNMTLPPGGRKR